MICTGCSNLVAASEQRFQGTVMACRLCAEAGIFEKSKTVTLKIYRGTEDTKETVGAELWFLKRFGLLETGVFATMHLKGKPYSWIDPSRGGPALKEFRT